MNVNDVNVWNRIEKPENVNVVALEGDILEKLDGVLFLLQTQNDYNNVVAYRVEKSSESIIKTFLEYCLLLYNEHNIKYIRVEGDKNKYDFIKRFFNRTQAIKDKTVKNRDVYYCNLENAKQTLELKLEEMRYYKMQNIYNSTTNEQIKKKCYDEMFFMMQFAIENAMKKRLGKLHVSRPDFYDLVMTATINVMQRYKKPGGGGGGGGGGYYTDSLLSTAYYSVLSVLHNKKQKFYDKCMSYEAFLEYESVQERNK